jgi:hypothetical protein
MSKIKLLFIALLLSLSAHAQTLTPEQTQVQQAIENLFAALTDADTTAMKTFALNSRIQRNKSTLIDLLYGKH